MNGIILGSIILLLRIVRTIFHKSIHSYISIQFNLSLQIATDIKNIL